MKKTAKLHSIQFENCDISVLITVDNNPTTDGDKETQLKSLKPLPAEFREKLNSIATNNNVRIQIDKVTADSCRLSVSTKDDSQLATETVKMYITTLLQDTIRTYGLTITNIRAVFSFILKVDNIEDTGFGDYGKIYSILSSDTTNVSHTRQKDEIAVRTVATDLPTAERHIFNTLKTQYSNKDGIRAREEFADGLQKVYKPIIEKKELKEVPEELEKKEKSSAVEYAATAYPVYLSLMRDMLNVVSGAPYVKQTKSKNATPQKSLTELITDIKENADTAHGNSIAYYRKDMENIFENVALMFWAKFRAKRLRGAVWHERVINLLKEHPEYEDYLKEYEESYNKLEEAADNYESVAVNNSSTTDDIAKAEGAYTAAQTKYEDICNKIIKVCPEADPKFCVSKVDKALMNFVEKEGGRAIYNTDGAATDVDKERLLNNEFMLKKRDLQKKLYNFNHKEDNIDNILKQYFLPEDIETVKPYLFYIFPGVSEYIDSSRSTDSSVFLNDTLPYIVQQVVRGAEGKNPMLLQEEIRKIIYGTGTREEKQEKIGKLLEDSETEDFINNFTKAQTKSVCDKIEQEVQRTEPSLTTDEIKNKTNRIIATILNGDYNIFDRMVPDEKLRSTFKDLVSKIALFGKDRNFINALDFVELGNKKTDDEAQELLRSTLAKTNDTAQVIVESVIPNKSEDKPDYEQTKDFLASLLKQVGTTEDESGKKERIVSYLGAHIVPGTVKDKLKQLISENWGSNKQEVENYIDTNFNLSKYANIVLRKAIEILEKSAPEVAAALLSRYDLDVRYYKKDLPPFFDVPLEEVEDVEDFNERWDKYDAYLDELSDYIKSYTTKDASTITEADIESLKQNNPEEFKALTQGLKAKYGISIIDVLDKFNVWRLYLEKNSKKTASGRSLSYSGFVSTEEGDIDSVDKFFTELESKENKMHEDFVKDTYLQVKTVDYKKLSKKEKIKLLLSIRKSCEILRNFMNKLKPEKYNTLSEFIDRSVGDTDKDKKHYVVMAAKLIKYFNDFYEKLSAKSIPDAYSVDTLLERGSETVASIYEKFINDKNEYKNDTNLDADTISAYKDTINTIREQLSKLDEIKTAESAEFVDSERSKLFKALDFYSSVLSKHTNKGESEITESKDYITETDTTLQDIQDDAKQNTQTTEFEELHTKQEDK